jgi:hypothetical protein
MNPAHCIRYNLAARGGPSGPGGVTPAPRFAVPRGPWNLRICAGICTDMHWDLRFGTPVVPAERHTQLLPS